MVKMKKQKGSQCEFALTDLENNDKSALHVAGSIRVDWYCLLESGYI